MRLGPPALVGRVVEHDEAFKPGALVEHVVDIRRGVGLLVVAILGDGAAHGDAGFHVDQVEHRFQAFATDIVEESVDTVRTGGAQGVLDRTLAVVDGRVGAEIILDPGALVGRPGDRDDATTHDLADLHGDRSHCTGSAGNHHGLAGFWVQQVENAEVGRQADVLEEAEARRQRQARIHVDARDDAAAIGDRIVLPAEHAGDDGANRVAGMIRLFHHAHGEAAHHLAEFHRGHVAGLLACPEPVRRIEREVDGADQKLVVAGFRHWRFAQFEIARPQLARGPTDQIPLPILRHVLSPCVPGPDRRRPAQVGLRSSDNGLISGEQRSHPKEWFRALLRCAGGKLRS